MNDKKTPSSKGLSGNQILILVIVVSVAVVAVVFFATRPSEIVEPFELPIAVEERGGARVATAENLQEITDSVRTNVERGMFATYMTSTWTFPDGNSPSRNAVKGNSASNNYPFWFTVTEQSSGEVVFTSGLIPLGSQLADITLDVPLPAGEYDAVVTVNMVDENNELVDSNVGIGIRLIIQN